MNRSQAKNIQKHLTLARSTTGDESEKHYQEVDRLISKYGIYIPESRVDYQEIVATAVDTTREARWNKFFEKKGIKKVFYKHNELWGFRFYKKALLNLDFESIVAHIKRVYFK
jgi:hypothetical protein